MRMSATSRAAQGAKRRSRDTRDNDEQDELQAQTGTRNGTRTSMTIDLVGGPAPLPCKTKRGRAKCSRKHRRVENDVKVNKMKIKSRAREWRLESGKWRVHATQKTRGTQRKQKTANRKRARTQNTLAQAARRRDLI